MTKYPFYFSLVTIFATWCLLIVGGLVNPMGASMACPDWYFFPTCNGELWPDMVGGVLYEHGHRLAASVVGYSTGHYWRCYRVAQSLCLSVNHALSLSYGLLWPFNLYFL